MFSKAILSILLVSSSAVFAAPATNSAAIIDGEKVTSLDISNNNWAIVANNANGKTKLREFYDMGDLGVQQIDYVVSCADQKLSLAGFKVLTAMSSKDDNQSSKNIADLSFYTPVIQHDINIVSKVCSDQMLTRSAKVTN